jgi:hypothetical protein
LEETIDPDNRRVERVVRLTICIERPIDRGESVESIHIDGVVAAFTVGVWRRRGFVRTGYAPALPLPFDSGPVLSSPGSLCPAVGCAGGGHIVAVPTWTGFRRVRPDAWGSTFLDILRHEAAPKRPSKKNLSSAMAESLSALLTDAAFSKKPDFSISAA